MGLKVTAARIGATLRAWSGLRRLTLPLSALLAVGVLVAPSAAQSIADGFPVSAHGPSATVIMSSPQGEGRLIESFGDLAKARHVAVLVPGVSWTGPLVRDERDATRRHPAVQARALLAEMQRLDPSTPAAVVVWLNYDPPTGLDADAAQSARAIDGAPRLTAFVNSLDHRDRVTLVCHSYGSVVCGHAASQVRVASIIAIGSPGMDVERAADLRSRAPIWAALAPDDPIALVPYTMVDGFGHGANPASPEFGALALPHDGAHGHNGYLAAGSQSLTSIASIAVGVPVS
jgi:hypothetical protein